MSSVINVPVSDIRIPEGRYRKKFTNIESLAESISKLGQLVPIIITDDYVLIAGERRLKAHQMLGKQTIKAIIHDKVEIDNKVYEIIENLHREDFDWQEKVLATEDLHNMLAASKINWSERKSAAELKISTGKITQDLNLAEVLKTNPEVFSGCKTKGQALAALKKYKIDEAQAELALRATKKDYGRKASNHVFNGNAVDLIKQLPKDSIDVLMSDTPYGINISDIKMLDVRKDIYEDSTELYRELMTTVINEASGVLKKNSWIVLFCAIQQFYWLYDLVSSIGFNCDDKPAIWYRSMGQCPWPAYRMGSSYEAILYGFRGDASIIKQGRDNVFTFKGVNTVDKDHPVEKPVDLMEELISIFCLPGSTILDPFCGSGTTIVAGIRRGMLPIGFELNEKYYNLAINRISDTLSKKDAGLLNMD